MKVEPRCSEVNESSLVRESVFDDDVESGCRVTCRDAAVKTGLSERRTSRRKTYSNIRGFSFVIVE